MAIYHKLHKKYKIINKTEYNYIIDRLDNQSKRIRHLSKSVDVFYRNYSRRLKSVKRHNRIRNARLSSALKTIDNINKALGHLKAKTIGYKKHVPTHPLFLTRAERIRLQKVLEANKHRRRNEILILG
jgi:hypothetical protein